MTIHKSLIAFAVSALLATAAQAAEPVLPKDLPPYAPDKPLPVPQIEKKTLANGLEVWVVPRSGIPRVDYVLAVRNAGLAADRADASGYASLLAGLLTEGTDKRDSRAVAETAQGYGGSISAAASNDGISVYADALASHADGMLGLLAEVVRSPSFPENEVKLAQANAAQQLKASEAQPSFRANRAMLAALYGDHPYARTALSEGGIAALASSSLRSEHARRFHPDRSLLVITGKVTPAQGFAMAEKAFADWKASGPDAADTPAAPRQATPRFVLLQREGSVQSTVRIGRPALAATDADYLPLQLTRILLGGGFSSRVNLNLREEKGYTYGAGVRLGAARAGGELIGQADVRNEVTGASLKEFFHEYTRLGSEPVPAKELEDTKRYIAGDYVISNQLQGAVAASLAKNWLIGLPSEFLGQFVPRLRAVDGAKVQSVAKQYFQPKDQSIVVVGDSKAIAEQLKAYGEFQVQAK
ncbi:MAG TPA: pitrilysin family protein [Pseudoxanthomonas sp.]|nr:pitrilysin family protein [Pseudoxanthomonas sp.]